MLLALSLNLIFPIARGEAVSIVLGVLVLVLVLVLFLFLFLVLRSLGVVPSELHRRHIPREELLRKALELAFRFD